MYSPSPTIISPKHSLDPFLALRMNDLASPKSPITDISINGHQEIEKTLAMFNDNEKFSSVADQMRLKLSEIERQKHEMLIELIGWKTKYMELEPKLDELKNENSAHKLERESFQGIKEELIDKIEKLSSLLIESQVDRANLKATIKELEAKINPLESFTMPDWPSRARSGFKRDLFDDLLVAKKKIAEQEQEITDLKARIKYENGPKLKTKPGALLLDDKKHIEAKLMRNHSAKSHISVLDGDKENIAEMTSDSCRLKTPKTAAEILKYQVDITNLKHSIEILLTENQRLVDTLHKFEKPEIQKPLTVPTEPNLKKRNKSISITVPAPGPTLKKNMAANSTAKVVRLDLNINGDVVNKPGVTTPVARKNSAPKVEVCQSEVKNYDYRRASVNVSTKNNF